MHVRSQACESLGFFVYPPCIYCSNRYFPLFPIVFTPLSIRKLSHLQQEKICETKSFINVKQKSVEMKNKCFVWLMAILLMVPIGLSAQEITVKGNVTDSTG